MWSRVKGGGTLFCGMFEIEHHRKGNAMDDTKSCVIDDETPATRAADKNRTFAESVGQGGLDRDRDPFTKEEIAIAEKIGLGQ